MWWQARAAAGPAFNPGSCEILTAEKTTKMGCWRTLGGRLVKSESNACKIAFENRGPIGTYSGNTPNMVRRPKPK
jgi:hypothetical protein